MPREVWLAFALWVLYAPLLLLTAWFCARRSRHALSIYGLLALMWLSSSLATIGQQGWGWLNLDSLLLALAGLVATVLHLGLSESSSLQKSAALSGREEAFWHEAMSRTWQQANLGGLAGV